jgi:hypothetical protein
MYITTKEGKESLIKNRNGFLIILMLILISGQLLASRTVFSAEIPKNTVQPSGASSFTPVSGLQLLQFCRSPAKVNLFL